MGAAGGGGVGTVVGAGGGGGVGASVTDSELVFSVPSETELTSLSDSSDGSLTANSDEQEIVAKQHKARSALSLYLPLLLIIQISFHLLVIGVSRVDLVPTFTFPTFNRGRPEFINNSIHKLKSASGKFVCPDTG